MRPQMYNAVGGSSILYGAQWPRLSRPGEPALRELAGTDPARFDVLAVAVIGTYYMLPSVRRLLGYPGQEAGSVDVFAELALYVDEGLLAPVVRRGPVYRAAPGEG